MLIICTKAALCVPFDPPDACSGKGFCMETPFFTMTKAECEALIDNRVRKDGPRARTALSCINEDEWMRRYPERPERPIKPIAR